MKMVAKAKRQAFEKLLVGLSAHQRPDNVITINQIGQEGDCDNEQVN